MCFFVVGLVPALNLIAWIAQLVILGFLDGIPGGNRFGEDPKGRNVEVDDEESRLAKLASMRDSGIITDEEYSEQRANIIAQV